jgi:hypothetical protein
MKKLVILIMVLGLVSCTEIKPTTAVIYEVSCGSENCECYSRTEGRRGEVSHNTFWCDNTYHVGDTVYHNVKK